VVLENHLHAAAQAPDLPAAWAQFKSISARRLIQTLEAHGARRLLDRMLVPSKA